MTVQDAACPTDLTPIGGFFESHEPAAGAGASLTEAWAGRRAHAAFVNARSAFAALAAATPGSSVWLPAFLCRDLIQPAYARRVRFYPVREGFEPDLDGVATEAASGDLVLVVAYFGEPVAAATWRTLARRPDLRVVEDCAQALEPGPNRGAAWRLFSPRKLLGVADGGLLVAMGDGVPPQPTGTPDAVSLWAAPNLRSADPQGRRNAEWHAASQAKEAAMAATREAMTQESALILARTALADLAGRRMANWRALDARLGAWSALGPAPAGPPLGYVLRLPADARERVLSGLHAQRIFAAVHWPEIAAPAGDFPREAAWTRELITLPCDHRYGTAEMARIADAFEALLR